MVGNAVGNRCCRLRLWIVAMTVAILVILDLPDQALAAPVVDRGARIAVVA